VDRVADSDRRRSDGEIESLCSSRSLESQFHGIATLQHPIATRQTEEPREKTVERDLTAEPLQIDHLFARDSLEPLLECGSQRGSGTISAPGIHCGPVSSASRIDAITGFFLACVTCRFLSFPWRAASLNASRRIGFGSVPSRQMSTIVRSELVTGTPEMFSDSSVPTAAKWSRRIGGIAVPLRKPGGIVRSSFDGLTSVSSWRLSAVRWLKTTTGESFRPRDQSHQRIRSGHPAGNRRTGGQAEDTAVLANPVTGADVVIPLACRVSEPRGLFRGEVAALFPRELKQVPLPLRAPHKSSDFFNHYARENEPGQLKGTGKHCRGAENPDPSAPTKKSIVDLSQNPHRPERVRGHTLCLSR